MATPPVLFKTEMVLKSNWYSRIKEIMINAGWKNVSSSRDIDFDVMTSVGESGDKQMVIQMKEFDTNATLTISGSTSGYLSTRLPQSYVPGSPGTGGTFGRSGAVEDYVRCLVMYAAMPANTLFKIHYHCNKNRIIIFNEYPDYTASIGSFQFMGISDRSIYESVNSGPIIANTASYISAPYYVPGTVRVSGHPGLMKPASYYNDVLTNMTPSTGLNPIGKYFMGEIAYGSVEEGVRGYIDGVYQLVDIVGLNIRSGDVVVDQHGIKYRTIELDVNASSTGRGPFTTPFLAFRTQ